MVEFDYEKFKNVEFQRIDDKDLGEQVVRYFFRSMLMPLCGMTDEEIGEVRIGFKLNDVSNGNSKIACSISGEKVIAEYDENQYCVIDGMKWDSNDKNMQTLFSEAVTAFFSLLKVHSTSIPNGIMFKSQFDGGLGNIPEKIGLDKAKSLYYESLYKLAIQKGICMYIAKNVTASLKTEEIISSLEDWSLKTYEGHKVCYGILINPKQNNIEEDSDEKIYTSDFKEFLEDEYSAVLSDGISSLLEIDCNNNFLGYVSITDVNDASEKKEAGIINESSLPYRFFDIINKYVVNDKVGLFLLQNGDIIVAKDREIRFIKRNGRWMNFSQYAFKKVLQKYMAPLKNTLNIIKSIYASSLDVSLSHTGGIIAVISDRMDENAGFEEIVDKIDKIREENTYEDLYFQKFEEKYEKLVEQDYCFPDKNIEEAIYKKEKGAIDNLIKYLPELKAISKDIIKRLTKRKYILKLIKNKKFHEIDRKLRAELIGLDGACILDSSGQVIAFGAIIINDAGSSGGGRGAAAKKLSNYGGFAIKISTDGYIEVFSASKRVYSIK